MNGWAQNWYYYQPFGQTSQSKPSFDNWNRFRFTGREADETGLYYYRARYYAPDLGRFISEDPTGLDELGNQYAYAENDPVNLVDPLGLNVMRPQGALGYGGPRPYHGDPDFVDYGLPGGFPVTPNGVRKVVVGDFQFFGQVAGYVAHRIGDVFSSVGATSSTPRSSLPSGEGERSGQRQSRMNPSAPNSSRNLRTSSPNGLRAWMATLSGRLTG